MFTSPGKDSESQAKLLIIKKSYLLVLPWLDSQLPAAVLPGAPQGPPQ